MSELRLTASSSLKSVSRSAAEVSSTNETAGVSIQERSDLTICSVFARKGAEAQLARRVKDIFGLELPEKPTYCRAGPVAIAWAGRSQWLVLQDGDASDASEQRLRSSLTDIAAIINQSDGRTIVRVSGPHIRSALAKGLPIDLHSNSFSPGDAAITSIGQIAVNFWQVDALPTYEFSMFRSFAVAFWEWLIDAATEFGVVIKKRPEMNPQYLEPLQESVRRT